MTKVEILEKVINLASSSFVDDNYDETNIHKLFDDSVEYACDECEDYGIDYTEEEIAKYLQNYLDI